MTSLLHYWLASSGDLSLLFLTLLTVVNWQHLELGKQMACQLVVDGLSLTCNQVQYTDAFRHSLDSSNLMRNMIVERRLAKCLRTSMDTVGPNCTTFSAGHDVGIRYVKRRRGARLWNVPGPSRTGLSI